MGVLFMGVFLEAVEASHQMSKFINDVDDNEYYDNSMMIIMMMVMMMMKMMKMLR